jgi:signal transduction histidine kinase
MDVTERIEHEREVVQQNERLDEFATLVSHDLRNPLTVAKNRLAIVQEEFESEHLDHVAGALDQMDALVDDPEPVVLEPLVRRTWQAIETGDADLVVEAPCTVVADETKFRQVVVNLFRNALDHGAATDDLADLTVTVGTLDDGADPAGFYVADDGAGIDSENGERVFEPGYSTGENGTGFGLHIVAEIVTAHGWDIAVTESDDGGARFEITDVEFVR